MSSYVEADGEAQTQGQEEGQSRQEAELRARLAPISFAEQHAQSLV
jgi:hypothetical protein